MTVKFVRFPFVRDFSGFDFSAQPSLNPKQVRELADARWITTGENVLAAWTLVLARGRARA